MEIEKARKILLEYAYNITHVGEESEAIQVILNQTISFNELVEIVMSIPCKEPETYFVKGQILGTCMRKLDERILKP